MVLYYCSIFGQIRYFKDILMHNFKNLALFDLDHTLIPLDSDQEWGRFIGKLGIVDSTAHDRELARFYATYIEGKLDMNAYLNFVLEPLTRHSKSQLNTWHKQYMEEVILPVISQSTKDLLQRHKNDGDLCCIVTATNSFVTRPIAQYLGVDNILAIELDSDNDHPDTPFNGKWVGTPTFKEGKIIRVNEWLKTLNKTFDDFERTYFYSDSSNDIPLMEKVTHPVATNPDKVLRKVAMDRGWQIIELAA